MNKRDSLNKPKRTIPAQVEPVVMPEIVPDFISEMVSAIERGDIILAPRGCSKTTAYKILNAKKIIPNENLRLPLKSYLNNDA
jgi:hypothetical protein